MIRMRKAKKQFNNQMGQQEYWLEMYEKEHQKYEKKYSEKFKEIRYYDQNDYSDEAIWYRICSQAAPKTMKRRMLDKNLDCNFFLEMVLEIEDRNVRKWREVDCGVPSEGVRKDEAKSKSVEVNEAKRKIKKIQSN